MIIFHITKKSDFEKSLSGKDYGNFLIKKDGFTHCCTFEQLLDIANNNLKNISEKLIVVCVNTNYLTSEIKWEKSLNSKEIFPHIYGPINLESIMGTVDLEKDGNGKFFISDELFNYSKYEKSCGAVVVHKFENEYKALLINFADKTIWGFPKGHIEKNETEIETASREILEETGINVDIISTFRESTYISWKRGSTLEAVYYFAVSNDTKIKCQYGEVDDYLWCDFEKVCDYLTYDCDKMIFKKFKKFFETYIKEN